MANSLNKAEQQFPVNLYKVAEEYGYSKVVKSAKKSFGLAVFAGIFIALAFVFYLTVTTGAKGSPWGLVHFIGGFAFSLGLILVVICGAELFTSSVLSTVTWANRKITTSALLKMWLRVYCGNLVGALFILLLVMSAGLYQIDGGAWGLNALMVAQHKIHHSWLQAFSLGILCNMLVCLAIWMTFSTKNVMTRSFLVILPVAMFVSSGFEHCIANMFMVPLGIAISHFADVSFYHSIGVARSQFVDLTIHNFIFKNLIPVTLGNIVGGGVVIALGNWLIEQSPAKSRLADNK